MKSHFAVLLLLCFAAPASAEPWISDLGNGRYKNPALFTDYSDPDLIRVGGDFYMAASSFNAMPGIPVLDSKDLVNWTLIGPRLRAAALRKIRQARALPRRLGHADFDWFRIG